MKILTCVITCNRLPYTKNTVINYLQTSDLGGNDELVVVDNLSDDGTQEWVKSQRLPLIENSENLFPGAACNIGWHAGLKTFDADLLVRLDNDVELKPGWHKWVERYFKSMARLGQLGLLNAVEDYGEGKQPWEKFEEHGVELFMCNAGGPSVVRRELWDKGLRWAPGRWRPGGMDEDTQFTEAVRGYGYIVGKAVPLLATNQSFGRFSEFPDYYRRTAELRGLVAETSV